MTQLIFAALFFIGLHFGVAGTALRDVLIARLGERVYRGVFSVLSLAGLVWLSLSYRPAGYVETWGQLTGFKPFADAVMFLAVLMVVLGVTTPNPTAVNGEKLLRGADPAVGVIRITRHPFLWGVSLWAITHLIVNGDVASFVLFGSLLALVLGGMISIDNKRRRLLGKDWERFAAVTSVVPFAAIRRGRNRLLWREFKVWQGALALLVYGAILHLHFRLFGVTPW